MSLASFTAIFKPLLSECIFLFMTREITPVKTYKEKASKKQVKPINKIILKNQGKKSI